MSGTSEARSTLDPAQLAVLIARLTGVAEEMGAVLQRSAFSPNIKERADCSAALFTAGGDLLVQAEHIPVHLGSMPASVRAVLDALDRAGESPMSGAMYIVNDPFEGGTHLNDITVVAPCHVDGAVVGWAANRAHHADVGGAAPGSMPADAHEVFEEGLRLPPLRLTPEVRAVLIANSRTPLERGGDLDAQIGSARVGVERLARLVSGGVDAGRLDEVLAYGDRRMAAVLAAVPDGEWSASDVIDSFGPAPEQQRPGVIRVRLRITGDRCVVDFDGTDAQRIGNVSAPEAVTVSAAVFAVRSALDPDLPANAGVLGRIEVRAPRGSIVAAVAPAAVGAGNVEVSQRVADVCFAALAQAVPDRVAAASQGTMNNLLMGGAGWVYYETLAGGQGGRPPRPGRAGARPVPGMSGVHTAMTNTRNTPIEALERAFPLRVRRLSLRQGSGGAGAAPGGEGIVREVEVLEDTVVSLITERRASQPWGLAGGGPGASGRNELLPGGDDAAARRLPDKVTLRLEAGDVLRVTTPGGGGWGVPQDTEPSLSDRPPARPGPAARIGVAGVGEEPGAATEETQAAPG